jgi:hypothetical protein
MPSDHPEPSVPEAAPGGPEQPAIIAWQPMTPAGVAKFARASIANLYLVQLAVGALLTASLFWFLYAVWFPGIREAIHELPETGVVSNAVLEWTNETPRILLENRFLGFAVNPNAEAVTLASDVKVEFREDHLTICSVLGCLKRSYPPHYLIELNRPEAEPWWGAWQPIILGIVTIATPLFLLLLWAILAAIYCPIASLIAFYADRDLTWSGSWRLASAALMPGAVLLALAIVGYGSKTIDFLRFLIFASLHLSLGWFYVIISVFLLPRLSEASPARRRNPFVQRCA